MLRRILATVVAAAMLLVSPGSLAATEDGDSGALVDEIGQTMLARYPEEATELGLSAALGLDDSRLNDLSPEYRAETARLAQDALDHLAQVDTTTLDPEARITHAIAAWYLADQVTMAGHADHDYAVSFITGPHAYFGEFMADVHPLEDIDDAEAYVRRLEAVGEQLRQVGANLERAGAAGVLPTERGLEIAAWQMRNQVGSALGHPLARDFEARLDELDLAEDERERLVGAAREAVDDSVVPAYQELAQAVKAAASRSDERPGVVYHPGGDEYYAAVLRHHTTTALTPEEVHQIGLAEVERVREELSEALTAAGFDPAELGFARAVGAAADSTPAVPLRSDADREALLAATEDFIVEAGEAFAGMFTTWPASTVVVQRPRPGRESSVGAYYRPSPVIGERPGIYYLGLAGDAFPTDTYATVNYHEAVPGHHLQLALQHESEDLPLLQRAVTFTGHAEGWALYAERLAHEIGLYEDDPLGNIGRLRLELLRAARAVVDTGIHAFGWSRDEAVGYLMEQGFPEGWAASETDRYIVYPGQAPAYIVGLLEILRLREEARTELGDDFDISAFHDAVLRHGSVPLEVLPSVVDDYVESVRSSSPA